MISVVFNPLPLTICEICCFFVAYLYGVFTFIVMNTGLTRVISHPSLTISPFIKWVWFHFGEGT